MHPAQLVIIGGMGVAATVRLARLIGKTMDDLAIDEPESPYRSQERFSLPAGYLDPLPEVR